MPHICSWHTLTLWRLQVRRYSVSVSSSAYVRFRVKGECRRFRWARHVARVGERKDVYNIKWTLGRLGCRWYSDAERNRMRECAGGVSVWRRDQLVGCWWAACSLVRHAVGGAAVLCWARQQLLLCPAARHKPYILRVLWTSFYQPLWDRGPVNSFFRRRWPGPNRFTRKYLSIF